MGVLLDKILMYILIGLVGFFVVSLFSKLFAFYWKAGYDTRKKQREEKRAEKLKWKYCTVNMDNPLLNEMMSDRTIVFMGEKGKGKSLMMNFFAHFLWQKRLLSNKKNKRYNHYMKPKYIMSEQKLAEDNLLPIYSNLEFIDYETGAKKQELQPYFEMQKRAVEGAIFCIDEISSTYGKELYNTNDDDTNQAKRDIKENSKKNRHYTNGWILGTEQDGQDIFIGIRENGYALVHCLQTVVKIKQSGKFLRKLGNIFNAIFPAFCTVNVKKLLSEQLFLSGKIKILFKLLLPSFVSLPVEYYTNKQKINDYIKRKSHMFAVRFTYKSSEWWIRFTENDIFEYDTRAYKKDYEKLFDEYGNRKKEV